MAFLTRVGKFRFDAVASGMTVFQGAREITNHLSRSARRALRNALKRNAVAGFGVLEQLENRTLLSSVNLVGDTLAFIGDQNSSNTITATRSGDGQNIIANINGQSVNYSSGAVNSIVVTGGNNSDTIIIDPNINLRLTVTAGAGNDYISCGGGNSTVYGNGGDDTIIGNGGQNEFHGGAGNDSLWGGSGKSLLYGDDGNDTLIGGSGSDLISGGTGSNVTQGPAGDTIINNTNSQSSANPYHTVSLGAHILLKSTNVIYAGMAVQVNGLNSGLGVGNPNTTHYSWDFGDPGSKYNNLDGWNAGHIYNTPGQYTVTFTIVNQNGETSVDTTTVYVASADLLRTVYVAPWGNDNNDGLSTDSPINSVAQANKMLGSNTRVLFADGGTYNLENPINIDGYKNVELGSYGSGNQPILMWDGSNVTYTSLIVTQPRSANVAIDNFTFDSIYRNGNGEPYGIKFNGSNLAVSDSTFLHLTDAVDLSGAPIGTMVQDNSAPDPQSLRAYFVWVQGANAVILGNLVANSQREHVIRIGGAKQTLIAYNNLANLDGSAWGDSADGIKGVVTIQFGSYAYVDHNTLNGPSSVGPLATTQASALIDNFNSTFNDAVFDSNLILNGPFEFEPGSSHVMLRNNTIATKNVSAIIIQANDELYGRIVSDPEILGNTVIDSGYSGNFLHVINSADSIVLADNLFVANNLQVGSFQSAPVFVGDSSLQSFALISHNIWSGNTIPAGGTNPAGGSNYVFPSWWDPSGYLTASGWNNLSPVNGDIFETAHIGGNLAPIFNGNGIGGTYAASVPGLFADYYGKPRNDGSITVGAVQI